MAWETIRARTKTPEREIDLTEDALLGALALPELPFLSVLDDSLAGAALGQADKLHRKTLDFRSSGTGLMGPPPPIEMVSWATQRKGMLFAVPSLMQRFTFSYRRQDVVLSGRKVSRQTNEVVSVVLIVICFF